MTFFNAYQPIRLASLMADLEPRFKIYNDISDWMGKQNDPNIQLLSDRIVRYQKTPLPLFAYTIPESQLESLLVILVLDKPASVKLRIFQILKSRLKRRLAKPCWRLFQYYTDNTYLLNILKALARTPDSFREYPFLSLLMNIDNDEMLLERLHQSMLTSGLNLGEFYLKYDLDLESQLVFTLNLRFFSSCGHDLFHANEDMVYQFVLLQDVRSLPAVDHYLQTIEPELLSDRICLYLIEKYRFLDKDQFPWSIFEPICLTQMIQWSFLYKIRCYFKNNPKKAIIFNKYYTSVSNVLIHDQAFCLFIYFKTFVIVDLQEDAESSYIYDRKMFEQVFTQWTYHVPNELHEEEQSEDMEDVPAKSRLKPWPINLQQIIKARLAILSDHESLKEDSSLAEQICKGESENVIQLQFGSSQVLYARKFLDELIECDGFCRTIGR